jgi:hypothetical protein
VVDYIAVGTDIVLAAVAFIGMYYASVSTRLFKGDPIMERVWRLATVAFVIVALFSALDFIFVVSDSSLVELHLVRIAAVFGLAVFVAAMVVLVRWGRSSTDPKTEPSRPYPQH